MNLKPMDENTIRFLKDLIDSYEQSVSLCQRIGCEESQHLAGWRNGERHILHFAVTAFCELEPLEPIYLDKFVEAIKNADTDQ